MGVAYMDNKSNYNDIFRNTTLNDLREQAKQKWK